MSSEILGSYAVCIPHFFTTTQEKPCNWTPSVMVTFVGGTNPFLTIDLYSRIHKMNAYRPWENIQLWWVDILSRFK